MLVRKASVYYSLILRPLEWDILSTPMNRHLVSLLNRPSRIVPDMKYLWVPERYYKLWAY